MRAYAKLAVNRRVVVNLADGSAVEGVLWNERGPLVVLKDALLHAAGAMVGQPMQGEVLIERDRILFVQVP